MSVNIIPAEQIAIMCHYALTERKSSFYKWLDEAKLFAMMPDRITAYEKGIAQEILNLPITASEDAKFELMAKVLCHANIVSSNTRYNDNRGTLDYLARVMEVKEKMRTLTADKIDLPQYLTFWYSLDYNSCEAPNWEASLAKWFIDIEKAGTDFRRSGLDAYTWIYDEDDYAAA